MASHYRLQIVDVRDGAVVHGWEPGRRVESDLVREIVEALAKKPVGVFRTVARVQTEVRAAIEEHLYALKSKV